MKVGCVVMAAGSGNRFGGNKLLQTVDGRTMIDRTLSVIPAALFLRISVVTQYQEIEELAKEYHFTVIRNDRPDLGQSRSLRLGLHSMPDCDGVLFLVADQPFLQRRSIEKLVECFFARPDRIAALGHNGQRGNPCLFPARFFPELMAIEGDRGGNVVIRQHEDALLLLEVPERELMDIDTAEQLKAL